MIDIKSKVLSIAEKTNEQFPPVLEKLFSAAQPDAVYSKPVVAHNYTIITASEVTAGGGFGSGAGFGPATSSPTEQQSDGSESKPVDSGGSGMGGGGGSAGRPVAIIIIGPEGVSIKPIFDITKIALASIPVGITMLAMFRKVLHTRR